jgi:3-hydroxyacyl-CoA dehydrogenase
MHGLAFGGGLELALACHGRVAKPATRFAFPEVSLGLLPGGGGTQRAPRLIGVGAALKMMTDGKPVDASQAFTLGLIDAIAEEDLLGAALWHAASLHSGHSRVRDRTVSGQAAQAVIEAARDAASKRRDASAEAARCIVDCIEAAVKWEFDTGEAVEQRLFEQLLDSETSLGLRHVFLGERAVTCLPPELATAQGREIATTAVIGAGVMGSGIAATLLAAGLPVTLIDPDQAALDRATGRIRDIFERDVDKGRITRSTGDARMAALIASITLDDVSHADLIIEAVYEDMAVKRAVFEKLDAAAKPDAILATNTSTLDVDAIARATRDPGRVLGMHFFSPANIMRLVEIVRGADTTPAVLATAMRFARRIGKVGVVAGVCDGFIGNRMFEEYLRQAYFLLEEGALPQQVDKALEDFGFAMGPFKVMDLAGQDIGWSIRKRRAIEQPDRPYSRIPDKICELGRYGQKTGSGFYLYPDGRKAVVDPDIDALVVAHSGEIGLKRRAVHDEEIVSRCVLALVNEGARILEEGIAWRPVDIDVVWTAGYGFPSAKGGPMFHADRIGLQNAMRSIEAFQYGHQNWAWRPAPLLERLAERNQNFGAGND